MLSSLCSNLGCRHRLEHGTRVQAIACVAQAHGGCTLACQDRKISDQLSLVSTHDRGMGMEVHSHGRLLRKMLPLLPSSWDEAIGSPGAQANFQDPGTGSYLTKDVGAGINDGELAAIESLPGRMLQAVPSLLSAGWEEAVHPQQPGESFSTVYYLTPVSLTTFMPAPLDLTQGFAKICPRCPAAGTRPCVPSSPRKSFFKVYYPILVRVCLP